MIYGIIMRRIVLTWNEWFGYRELDDHLISLVMFESTYRIQQIHELFSSILFEHFRYHHQKDLKKKFAHEYAAVPWKTGRPAMCTTRSEFSASKHLLWSNTPLYDCSRTGFNWTTGTVKWRLRVMSLLIINKILKGNGRRIRRNDI